MVKFDMLHISIQSTINEYSDSDTVFVVVVVAVASVADE